LGELAGIHNGHLSSDKANAKALETTGNTNYMLAQIQKVFFNGRLFN